MNLTQIECLVKVVELGGYEHAAKALYMTPSAVAKNIKKERFVFPAEEGCHG